MANSVTLADLRTMAATALRDPQFRSYSRTDVDEAIRFIVAEFNRRARIPRTSGTVALTQGVYSVSFDGLPGFRGQNIVSCLIGTAKLDIVSFDTVRKDLNESPTATGKPVELGMNDSANVWVYPVPDQAYVLNVQYVYQLPDLINDGDSIPVNSQQIRGAVWWGLPAALRYAGREDIIAIPMWANFLEFCAEIEGQVLADSGDDILDEDAFL